MLEAVAFVLLGIGLAVLLAVACLSNDLALTSANLAQDHVTGLAATIAGAQLWCSSYSCTGRWWRRAGRDQSVVSSGSLDQVLRPLRRAPARTPQRVDAKGLALLPSCSAKWSARRAPAMAYPISTYPPGTRTPSSRPSTGRSGATLVDFLRLFDRWTLLGRDPGSVLEVGDWHGGSGALTAGSARALGIADPVCLCDTWEGTVKTGPIDIYYDDGKYDDTSRETAAAMVARLGRTGVELLQGNLPDDTRAAIAECRFWLCQLDLDVDRSAADVFDWARPRLSAGTVAVFDDYRFPVRPGVTRFVDEQRGKPDRLVLHNRNGHGIVVKR